MINQQIGKQILGLLVQDDAMLTELRPMLRPELFEYHFCVELSRIIFDFFDRYSGAPSKQSLIAKTEIMFTKLEGEAEHRDSYMETIAEIYLPVSDTDRKFIIENIDEMVGKSLFVRGYMDAIESTNDTADKRREAAEALVRAAEFTAGGKDDTRCTSLALFDRGIHIAERTAPVPTGFKTVDYELDGGLRRGEMGILCGPTGRGKTMILVQLAVNALLRGYSFFFITMEMSMEEIMCRIDACISGVPYHTIKKDKEANYKIRGTMEAFASEYPKFKQCRVMFREYQETTIPETKTLIQRTYQNEELPDLILHDYLDRAKATKSYDRLYDDLGLIYAQGSSMCKSLDRPMWTATQANRQAETAKVVGLEHQADSYTKARIADTLYTINQTKEEKARNLLWLHSAKQRSHSSVHAHHFRTEFECSRLHCIDHHEYQAVQALPSTNGMDTMKAAIGKAGIDKGMTSKLAGIQYKSKG
jgi:hypothetical protein